MTIRTRILPVPVGHAALAALLLLFTGCATRLGGMDVTEAFPDERVSSLILAVAWGNFAEADRQLKAGADINTVGRDGISPLIWVMGTTKSATKMEYMLKHGANPNYRGGREGASAMYYVAGGDRPDLLMLLLQYGGDPNLPVPQGYTPLGIAVLNQRFDNIKILVEHGAHMRYSMLPKSESVANTAAGQGRFDYVAYFLEKGLNHNLPDLAKDVYISRVPANSDAQRWKDKVIEMLKARGVKYPPDWPVHSQSPSAGMPKQ